MNTDRKEILCPFRCLEPSFYLALNCPRSGFSTGTSLGFQNAVFYDVRAFFCLLFLRY